MQFECLESRAMLVSEGEVFNLSRSFDATGLLGNVSSTIRWGDGTESAGTVVGGNTIGGLRVRFDYSLDSTGFFNTPIRRTVLEAAAASVLSRLGDSLSAISPTGTNTWVASIFHPATGATVNFNNLNIAVNELVVYVGAREFGGATLGSGGPGGVSANGTTAWLNTVQSRGEAGALATPRTDFGPWGGSIGFDISTNWYFGLDQSSLGANQQDFFTVAAHEFTHLIGFGTSPSWTALLSGSTFTGARARAAYDPGGNVPLSSDRGHWLETITDGGRPTLMGPVINAGIRDIATPLDLGALDDIGWELVATQSTLTAQHVYPDNNTFPISITYRGATVGEITDSALANITSAVPIVTAIGNQTAVRGQPISLTNIATISDLGFANPRATPPTTETFVYSTNWGDGSASDTGTATIDRVGAINTPTLASFDGTHTFQSAGTFTVTLRVTDDDGSAAQSTFQIIVGAPPVITLELNRNSFAENAGASAATLTIRRSAPAATTPVTISLVSSDTSEATVPTTATIPAGQLSATVPVAAVDDTLFDGTQSVTLTASAGVFDPGTIALSVTDVETFLVQITANEILENAAAGSFNLAITRSNTDVTQPLIVNIGGNVASQINLPTTAMIPVGSRQVLIPVVPINDDDPEPDLLLIYTVTATGYQSSQVGLILADDEQPLFQNEADSFDASGDGVVSLRDALVIINFLARRRGQSATLDPKTETPNGIFVDVNGDYRATPSDALRIVNEIGRRRREAQSSPTSPMVNSSTATVSSRLAPVIEIKSTLEQASFDEAITSLF